MKNIQVIDGAENAVYDIFTATDKEFSVIFPSGEDIAFIEEVFARAERNGAELERLEQALTMLWQRRVPKCEAMGIHGLLYYQHVQKAVYYPTRRDEEAINPDGSRLRKS